MGAWGTGLFSNDLALDVKDMYNEFLYLLEDDTQIKMELLRMFNQELELKENVSVFWYALADCMWRVGRLDDETKTNALYYLDNPEKDEDLKLWLDFKKDYKKRVAVLNKLKEKLVSLQPARRKFKIVKSLPAKFEIGDIICYQLTEKEHKKFVKTIRPKNPFIEDYDEIVKAYQSTKNTFDNNFICMVKLFDIEDSIDRIISFEKAQELNLIKHKEVVAVFQKITKEPLTIQEMYETPICDESKLGEELPVWSFEQSYYYESQQRLSRWEDPKFIDVNNFKVIGNDLELANFLIKKYGLEFDKLKTEPICRMIIRSLIEKENNFDEDW